MMDVIDVESLLIADRAALVDFWVMEDEADLLDAEEGG